MDAHIRDDDFVVMVCTETYYRRVVRKEGPGVGLGVAWEGSLIYNCIYRENCNLSRFVPVVPNGGSPNHIPNPVFGGTYYSAETHSAMRAYCAACLIGRRRQCRRLASGLRCLNSPWRRPPAGAPPSARFAAAFRRALGPAVGPQGAVAAVWRCDRRHRRRDADRRAWDGRLGKSVLAAATVRDDEVRVAFPDGIFWVGLGQTPDLLTRQADLHWLLTRERGIFTDAQQGQTALQEALRNRTCLIVLDDVWRLSDAEAFNIVDTGARLLLTTRDAAIDRCARTQGWTVSIVQLHFDCWRRPHSSQWRPCPRRRTRLPRNAAICRWLSLWRWDDWRAGRHVAFGDAGFAAGRP